MSIGTFAFSIMLVTSGVAPPIIGWLGIVASILVFAANGIGLVKPNSTVLLTIGGPMMFFFGGVTGILFEVSIGGWLLFFSHTIP